MKIELSEEMEEAEIAFANAYMTSTPEVIASVLYKIPIKILFRLNGRIAKMKSGKVSSDKKS